MSTIESPDSKTPEYSSPITIEGRNGRELIMQLPAGVDLEEARARWSARGGQVRRFGQTVDIDRLDFSEWLIQQEGARVAHPPELEDEIADPADKTSDKIDVGFGGPLTVLPRRRRKGSPK